MTDEKALEVLENTMIIYGDPKLDTDYTEFGEALENAIKALREKLMRDTTSERRYKMSNCQKENCIHFKVCEDKNYNYACPYFERRTDVEETHKGEWIAREDMDYLDENKVVHNHFMCGKCGFIHDFIDGHTSQYNFCPQCGASMKGGLT